MVNFSMFNSIVSVVRYFHSEEVCRDVLAQIRWGGNVVCPKCGKPHCVKRRDGRYRCNTCRHNFSVTTGTIFDNTKLPLQKWFIAMYLITSLKKGVSSHQIARDCAVSQKTAWYMLHKIRRLLSQEGNVILDREIECDEAYIGGQEKFKHEFKKTEGTQGRSLKTKTPVFGMAQRDGRIVAKKIQDAKGRTLRSVISQFVKPGSRIYTDEYIGYNTLMDSEYSHAVVNHGNRKFVVGEAHTNTIEGFWSQLKRSIFGIYHFVSAKYLQSYVDEAVYRYNSRKQSEGDRFEDMFLKSVGIVRYEDIRNVA